MTHNPSETGSRRPSWNKAPIDTKKKKKIIPIVFTLRFGRFRSGSVAQSNAGSPKSCGSKSSMLPSLSVASRVRLRLRLSSGTITTCMPAASPAFTPLGASSNTRHWAKRRGKTKRCHQVSPLRVERISPSGESAWAGAEHYEEENGIVWWNSHFRGGGALLTFAVCDSSLTWPPLKMPGAHFSITRGEKYPLMWQHNDSGGVGYTYSQPKIMHTHISKRKTCIQI